MAAQFAWKQKDTTRTIQYLLKGAQSGLRSKYLDAIPLMKSFTDTRLYNKVYEQMKAANEQYATTLAPGLRAEWMNRHGEQILAVGTGELGDYVTVVRDNVGRVKELLSKGEYPSERVMGLLDETGRTASNPSAYYALANYDCVITEMHDQLWEAVKRGDLHPREFASLWEWEYIKAAKSMKVVKGPVPSLIAQKLVMIHAKDNVYVTINRNCKLSEQRFRHFNLVIVREDIPAAEIDQNRMAYYIQDMETDAKKAAIEKEQGFRFFYGYK